MMKTMAERLALAEERIVALEKRVEQLEFLEQFGDVLPSGTIQGPGLITGGEWLAEYRAEKETDGRQDLD